MNIMGVRRVIGWILIGIALWLFWPIPGPDDIANIFMAQVISDYIGVSMVAAFIATYTIIPLLILYLGCLVMPGNTHMKFYGFLSKIKSIALRVVTNPVLLGVSLVMLVILYIVYVMYIAGMVEETIDSISVIQAIITT
jgi:hypothetical protein